MSDIRLCDIVEANMVLGDDNSLHVTMVLPESPKVYDKQKTPSDEWVLEVYNQLLRKGSVDFATPENPTRPVSAGTIDIAGNYEGEDYTILLTRKDKKAPIDSGTHALNNGYPNNEDEWKNPDLTIHRESAEERRYMAKNNTLLLPPDAIAKDVTLNSVKNMGLSYSSTDSTLIKYIEGPDTLEIVNSDDRSLYLGKGYFVLSSKTGANFIQIREIKVDHKDLIPYDWEGEFDEEGFFSPFEREVFVFSKSDLGDLSDGDSLDINRTGSKKPIYIWETKQGKRQIQTQKPNGLSDVYKPCPVVQRVIGQILDPNFNSIMHEIGETRKRIQGTYGTNIKL